MIVVAVQLIRLVFAFDMCLQTQQQKQPQGVNIKFMQQLLNQKKSHLICYALGLADSNPKKKGMTQQKSDINPHAIKIHLHCGRH